MKKTIVSISACVLFWQCGLMTAADASEERTSKKDVSVYQVPWRCPAALQIGCGSHAKPILLELEQNPGVSEAWLNRQGTAVAVVWEEDAKRKARSEAEKTLKEQKGAKLSGKEGAKVLADFESGKGWYRGAEVDRLSDGPVSITVVPQGQT